MNLTEQEMIKQQLDKFNGVKLHKKPRKPLISHKESNYYDNGFLSDEYFLKKAQEQKRRQEQLEKVNNQQMDLLQ